MKAPSNYRGSPAYQQSLNNIAKERSVLSKLRWQDEEYRAFMSLRNSQVSNEPIERERRRVRATTLWQSEGYRMKQKRARFRALNVTDALFGATL